MRTFASVFVARNHVVEALREFHARMHLCYPISTHTYIYIYIHTWASTWAAVPSGHVLTAKTINTAWPGFSVCLQCWRMCSKGPYQSMADLHLYFSSKYSFCLNPNVRKTPSDMCAQRRLKSACASVQSGQSRCCSHDEPLQTWLSQMCPMKILIKVREYSAWSVLSFGAHIWRYVFWRRGLIICYIVHQFVLCHSE